MRSSDARRTWHAGSASPEQSPTRGRRSLGRLSRSAPPFRICERGHRPSRASHRTDRATSRSRALPIEQLEVGTCSRPPYFAAGVDACPRTSRAPSVRALTCNCRIAAHRFSTVGRRRADWLFGRCDRDRRCRLRTIPSLAQSNRAQSVAPANIPEKSIAVLPFRNLSEDKRQCVFR